MPHEQMDDKQVAAYLHMDHREVLKLASRAQIPCRKVGGKLIFRKGDVDHWVENQLHELGKDRLAGIERGVSRHHGFEEDILLVAPMIPTGGVAAPLAAKTRDSLVRRMVALADEAGMVHAKDELIQEIIQREELCSTALAPRVALPHPRHPLPYDIAASFVAVGLTASGIPFGAADGSLTRLFFLICCKDDRTHLHVLARLGRMLHEPADVDLLLECQSPQELASELLKLEQRVLLHG